ncbi:MAG: D-glycero-beta-D-manno-heptose 1,7-bisphosphate 7-phosphatase [Methylovulum sp.]|nr:D-glycero-beta-D-manno-heptose 1,7-bisphosphate 7-phosphatase [Methylovulum sp.]
MAPIKNKSVFLDRDGVINQDKNYVHRIDDFIFIDGVFDACKSFVKAGYKIIIITNQAGIGRGYYTEHDFSILNDWMLAEFKRRGVFITAVYYCPHHAKHGLGQYFQACQCRKPEPGMLMQAASDHDIDLGHSILVGDKLSDIQAGKAAGVGRCFFVKTGKLIAEADSKQADGTFDNLSAIFDYIFKAF